MSSSAFEITKVEVIIWFCNNVFEANSCVFWWSLSWNQKGENGKILIGSTNFISRNDF